MADGSPVEGLEECYVEGEIEQWKVVSVPVTTSRRTQEEIKNTLQLRLNQPVMIISHNTAFMKMVRLKPSEAAKLIKRGEDYGEAYANALRTSASGEESLDGCEDVGGDGSGPGLGSDGGGDSGEGREPSPGVPSSGSDSDGEGEEEGHAEPPGGSGRFA